MMGSKILHGSDAVERYAGVPRVMWPVGEFHLDESLIGLCHRTCVDNIHETITGVLEAIGTPHERTFDLSVNRSLDLDRMAHVLRVPVEKLKGLVFPPEEVRNHVPVVSFFGAATPRYDLAFRPRRIAPAELAQIGYHRAIWSHWLIPFSPSTGEWLVDHCPRCSRRLTWYHTRGLGRCDDPACDFDLCSMPAHKLSPELFELAAPIARLLDPDPEVHGPAFARLPADFRKSDRGAAFDLIWRLGRLEKQDMARDAHPKIGDDDKLQTLCAAATLLEGWPGSLQVLMESDAEKGDVSHTAAIFRRLRMIATSKSTWKEHRTAMEDHLPERNTSLRSAVLELRKDAVNATKGAGLLGVRKGAFAHARRLGLLPGEVPMPAPTMPSLFLRSGMEQLGSLLRNKVALGAISQRLGISWHGVEQLCCLGVIASLDQPIVKEIFRQTMMSGSDFLDVLQGLEAGSDPAIAVDGSAVPIRQALMRIGGREKPWGPIIAEMLDGNIEYALVPGSQPLVRRILIRETDGRRLCDLTFSRADHSRAFQVEMPKRCAEEVLNMPTRLVLEACRHELRDAVTPDGRLAVERVLKIARSRISAGEILARWGTGRRLPPALKDGIRFPRLGVTGWNRAEIEKELGPDVN